MSTLWPTSSIGALFDIGAGKSVTPASRGQEPKRSFLRTSNVLWGRFDLSEVDRMFFTDEEFAAKDLRSGDLLVCEGGDIGRAAVWQGQLAECSFQNHLHRLRPRRPDVCPEFYQFALEGGITLFGLIEGVGNRTTIPNLSRNRLAELTVPLPPPDEQRKIAAVLGKVQTTVTVEGDLLRVARELKQASLRQLLTRGLRGEPQKQTDLGPVPDSWDLVRLEECCSVLSSGLSYTDFLDRAEAVATDAIDCMGVKVSDMNLDGNEMSFTIANLRKKIPMAEAMRRAVPSETVVFPKRGAAIATNKKRMTTTWTVLDPNLIGVRAGERLLPWFLFQWFQQFDLHTITEPGPTPQLNKKNLTPLLLPIPSLGEQREIINLLATLDMKIAHHEARYGLLQKMFRTLLHDLLTARRRVTGLDLTALT